MNNLQENQTVAKGILSLNLYELDAFKEASENQHKLVADNPYTEITNNKTYTEATKRRTALRQGRYDLQNGLKVIKDKLNHFKSDAESITDELIDITKAAEDKQQAEVTRYEAEKEAEKKRKEEEERQRKDAIKKAVSDFRNQSNESIAGATINTIEGIQKDIIDKAIECAEFQDDFEAVKSDLVRLVEQKRIQLQETENVRIAQIEITRERARFTELRKYDHIYPGEDLGRISETDFLEIRETQRKAFQEAQSAKIAKETADKAERERIESENKAEREKLESERKAIETEKARIEKEEQERKYKIRVDALLAIGLKIQHGMNYDHDDYDSIAIPVSDIKEISDDEFFANIELVKTRMAKQDQEKKEKAEREAKEKAACEITEAARRESLKPDKQKMIESLNAIVLPVPELSSDEMWREWEIVREEFRNFINTQTTIIENL